MLNPLRSEPEAFRFLVWVAGLALFVIVVITVTRAL